MYFRCNPDKWAPFFFSSLLLPQLMCGPVILRKGGKEKKEIGDEKLPLFRQEVSTVIQLCIFGAIQTNGHHFSF
jgi:hypothetical protein